MIRIEALAPRASYPGLYAFGALACSGARGVAASAATPETRRSLPCSARLISRADDGCPASIRLPREEIDERWAAQRIGRLRAVRRAGRNRRADATPRCAPQAYRLTRPRRPRDHRERRRRRRVLRRDDSGATARARQRRGACRASDRGSARRCSGGFSRTTFRAGRCRRCGTSRSGFARSRHSR